MIKQIIKESIRTHNIYTMKVFQVFQIMKSLVKHNKIYLYKQKLTSYQYYNNLTY